MNKWNRAHYSPASRTGQVLQSRLLLSVVMMLMMTMINSRNGDTLHRSIELVGGPRLLQQFRVRLGGCVQVDGLAPARDAAAAAAAFVVVSEGHAARRHGPARPRCRYSVHHLLFLFLFQTNDKGRLAPLTCHEYSRVKHIKVTSQTHTDHNRFPSKYNRNGLLSIPRTPFVIPYQPISLRTTSMDVLP